MNMESAGSNYDQCSSWTQKHTQTNKQGKRNSVQVDFFAGQMFSESTINEL